MNNSTIQLGMRIGSFRKKKKILGVKLNSRCFSMKTKSLFIVYDTLYFIQMSCRSYDRCPSFTHEMDSSIHFSIFSNHSEWFETNDNQMALCAVDMLSEVRLPNLFFYGSCYMCASIFMKQNCPLFFQCFWFSFINCCL